MITRKTLLYICFVGIGFFFLSASSSNIGLCPSYSYSSCAEFSNGIAENLLPVFPLLLLSLVTYKMRDEVYRAWLRFARVWIPLSMVLILFAPEYSGDWMFPITKGSVAFFSSLLFIIISSVVIFLKSTAIRRA